MDVNWLDAAILLVFFWLGFTGFLGGLLRSGLTTLAFLIGVLLAGLLYTRLANDLKVFISDETTVSVIALFAIFAATALAGQLLAIMLKQAFAVVFFGPFDSIGGLVLGLVQAFITVELALIVFVQFHDRIGFFSTSLDHSLLAPYFLKHIPLLTRFLPSQFSSAVNQFTQSNP